MLLAQRIARVGLLIVAVVEGLDLVEASLGFCITLLEPSLELVIDYSVSLTEIYY